MLVDMDRFRRVNDKLGFMLGDVCLKVIADCIIRIDGDKIISRFGGDEFAVLFKDITSEQEAVPVVEAFLKEIRQKVQEKKELDALSVSIGIALSDSDKSSFSDIFLRADKALYFAKQQGGGTYYFYHRTASSPEDTNMSRVDLNQLIQLIKEEHYYEDPLQIAYSEIRKIYEFVKHIAASNHQQVHMIMFTVFPNEGTEVSVEERERVMEILERAIMASVRGMDVTMKYSSTQRLVILMNPDEEQIQSITEHIMKEFYKMYDRKEISVYYDMADLS